MGYLRIYDLRIIRLPHFCHTLSCATDNPESIQGVCGTIAIMVEVVRLIDYKSLESVCSQNSHGQRISRTSCEELHHKTYSVFHQSIVKR